MQLSIKNRNKTYQEIFEKLPEARKRVYETIFELGYASVQEVARILDKLPSEISGRFTELKFFGLIKEKTSSVSNRSNNKVTVYTCTTSNERIDIINKHYQELIDKQKELENDFQKCLSNYTLEVVKLQIHKIKKKIDQLSKFC